MSKPAPRVSIILPTYNHEGLLRLAVESVQAQTVQDFELFIIGDGATPATRAIAQDLAAHDPRITFFDYAKDKYNGEQYRHQLITTRSRGSVIAYMADDDLWLSDHLETMLTMLADADVAHTLSFYIDPQGQPQIRPVQLNVAYFRKLFLSGKNRIGLSCFAHTRACYDRLPYGWQTIPVKPEYKSLHLHQQYLQKPELIIAESTRPTVLILASAPRTHMTLSERLQELEEWHKKISQLDFRLEMTELLLKKTYADLCGMEADLHPKLAAYIEAHHNTEAQLQKVIAEKNHTLADLKLVQEVCRRYENDIRVLQQALDEERKRSAVARQAPASKLN
jgi:hypothetical protein